MLRILKYRKLKTTDKSIENSVLADLFLTGEKNIFR